MNSYSKKHRYRSSALKSRIIPLNAAFLSYLREDGIVLPPSTPTSTPAEIDPNDTSTSTGWDNEPDDDPSVPFSSIHQAIKDTISSLSGLVAPKLNWSAPKDATWISMKKNSMECSTPNDIYLLLKSSDFITHDLEHAFDDCAPPLPNSKEPSAEDINYVLVLRQWFKVNPSCEFRCFVRERQVIGICQRDLNHFEFLFPLQHKLTNAILEYFQTTLKYTFPDPNFAFDVYIPEPYDRVRLVDINPWAPRTDPLLFSWLELLTMSIPAPLLGVPDSSDNDPSSIAPSLGLSSDEDTQDEDRNDEVEEVWKPQFRLVKKDDPEAYSFSTPQYSAHKLPKDVVDASLEGESGMREFADQWKRMLDGGVEMQGGSDAEADDEDDAQK
jgi:hypothetical protein